MRALIAQTNTSSPAISMVSPPPRPQPDEMTIRVAACGLNYADLLLAKGTYQEQRPFPVTLGMEISGVVECCGAAVETFAPGDRVAAFNGHGGLAEMVNVSANRCIKLPDSLDFDIAAAFQVAYGTSHMALDYKANLRPGDRLLVLGAAGGVGLTAVEIGKQMGAHVTAVARGADKLGIARKAGADVVIDGRTPDLKAALKAQPRFDVVYDPVGGDGFRAALGACAPEARYLLIGFAGGLPDIPANHLLVKNVSVIGFWWGGYLDFAPAPLTNSLETLLGWLEQGKLRPHIGHLLPLDRAEEGLELIRSRKAIGKAVIEINQSDL